MQWLAPQFEKAGLINLANWEWGFRNITNNKKTILKPEDVKGLKIRVPPEMQMTAAFQAVSELARQRKLYMRDAAYIISVSRVAQACKDRGWI